MKAASPSESAAESCYRRLIDLAASLQPDRAPEAILQAVSIGTTLATNCHVGRFADGLLENHVLRVAEVLSERHETTGVPVSIRFGRRARRVLHVSSMVFGVGGHSRMIQEWARRDPTAIHCLAITQQDSVPTDFSCDSMRQSGGTVWTLGTRTPATERARRLRALAREFDVVIMHIWPADVTALAAFGVPSGPPVALVNHADHVFWLGNAVADVLINLRPIGQDLSASRRYPQQSVLLPIPIQIPRSDSSRAAARRRLGLPESQLVLVSVGRGSKYAPTSTHAFFATASRVLKEHPTAHLYLVGPTPAEVAGHVAIAPPNRVHLLGPVIDSASWLQAADVYLESFPFGSQTATLEAAALGPAIIPALAPPTPLLAASDVAFEGLLRNADTELEYLAQVTAQIAGPKAAVRADLKASVIHHHVSEVWNERVADLYTRLDQTRHSPRPLPAAPRMDTPTDAAIRDWQLAGGFGDIAERMANDLARGAYWARLAGEWRASLKMLRSASAIDSNHTRYVSGAAKTLVRTTLGKVWPLRRPQSAAVSVADANSANDAEPSKTRT